MLFFSLDIFNITSKHVWDYKRSVAKSWQKLGTNTFCQGILEAVCTPHPPPSPDVICALLPLPLPSHLLTGPSLLCPLPGANTASDLFSLLSLFCPSLSFLPLLPCLLVRDLIPFITAIQIPFPPVSAATEKHPSPGAGCRAPSVLHICFAICSCTHQHFSATNASLQSCCLDWPTPPHPSSTTWIYSNHKLIIFLSNNSLCSTVNKCFAFSGILLGIEAVISIHPSILCAREAPHFVHRHEVQPVLHPGVNNNVVDGKNWLPVSSKECLVSMNSLTLQFAHSRTFPPSSPAFLFGYRHCRHPGCLLTQLTAAKILPGHQTSNGMSMQMVFWTHPTSRKLDFQAQFPLYSCL